MCGRVIFADEFRRQGFGIGITIGIKIVGTELSAGVKTPGTFTFLPFCFQERFIKLLPADAPG